MADMGHGYAVLNGIAKPDEKAAWNELYSKPLPKLVDGFRGAYDVLVGLKLGDSTRGKWDNWISRMGYTDAEGKPNLTHPIKGEISIVFTDSFGNPMGEMDFQKIDKHLKEVRRMQDELWKLGCQAIPIQHITRTGSQVTYQFGLFHPAEKLNDVPNGVTKDNKRVYDSEGKVLFLAYLLHKALVTEGDIPPGHKANPLLEPFGQQALGQAMRPRYQNIVRQALSEPLLEDQNSIRR